MYTLSAGDYKFGVQVGSYLVIPCESESKAKLIAKQMAGLIMDTALEARK